MYYINYFINLINSNFVFWFCALAGSGMFFLQFIINMFGFINPDGIDASHVDDATADSSDAKAFKWLSMHTITGFLMMFGWTGITCQNEFGLQNVATISISTSAGLFAAIVIRTIFKFANKLKSSGSVFKIEEAIGKEAYVYQRIPKGGLGKISMTLQDFTHEIDAVSSYPEELPSFTRVTIIEKKDDHTVVVIAKGSYV